MDWWCPVSTESAVYGTDARTDAGTATDVSVSVWSTCDGQLSSADVSRQPHVTATDGTKSVAAAAAAAGTKCAATCAGFA